MENNKIAISVEQQFGEVIDIAYSMACGRLCFSQIEKRRMGKQGCNTVV